MSDRSRTRATIRTAKGRFKGHDIEYRAGHFIARLADRIADPAALISRAPGGLRIRIVARHRNQWLYCAIVDENGRIVDRTEAPALIEQLDGIDGIEWAEPDLILRAATRPDDPMLVPRASNEQWGLECIRMYDAWDIPILNDLDSVVIGLLDSGIPVKDEPPAGFPLHTDLESCIDHPDFDGKRFIAGRNYVPNDDGTVGHSLNDTTGHGTNMAGIIAAKENNGEGLAGVNWGALVYVTRVLDPGNLSTVGFMLQGLQDVLAYAAANGKKAVVNLCAVYAIRDLSDVAVVCNAMFPLFESVVAADAILCLAAGNNWYAGRTLPYLEYPAKLGIEKPNFSGNVLVVGAIGKDLKIWEDSGRGVMDMVFAPGQNVGTTDARSGMGYYQAESGTSIATSHVSALAALMWSKAPSRSAREIVCCLKCTAREPVLGAGYRVVNAHAALQAV